MLAVSAILALRCALGPDGPSEAQAAAGEALGQDAASAGERDPGWADRPIDPPELQGAPARVGPKYDENTVAAINRSAERIGLGYGTGIWGRGFAQDLRLTIPLGKKKIVGLRTRFVWFHGGVSPRRVDDQGRKIGGYDPAIIPTLELFVRTPVIYGIFRIYWGAGIWTGIRPFPMDVDDPDTPHPEDARIGAIFPVIGGGHSGVEFFPRPGRSFFIEIGGQGPAHALWKDVGASVLAGGIWYLGRGGRQR